MREFYSDTDCNIEVYNSPQDNIEMNRPADFFTFLEAPLNYQVEDLEVFLDYKLKSDNKVF